MENKNNIIADFMGWPKIPQTENQFQVPGLFPYSDYKGWVIKDPEDMLFQKSWDWIVPVIVKYHNLDLQFQEKWVSWCQEIDNAVTEYHIAWVYDTLIQAIDFYNSSLK